MIDPKTAEDVYPAVNELISELQSVGQSRLAAILDHRIHRVVWTSRSELFTELRDILRKAVANEDGGLPALMARQMQKVLLAIEEFLKRTG